MRMVLVVILEPSGDLSERLIRDRMDADVIPLHGFDEGLRDAVAFRAGNRGEARLEAEAECKVPRILCGVRRPIAFREA